VKVGEKWFRGKRYEDGGWTTYCKKAWILPNQPVTVLTYNSPEVVFKEVGGVWLEEFFERGVEVKSLEDWM